MPNKQQILPLFHISSPDAPSEETGDLTNVTQQINTALQNYLIQDMNAWENVDADLIITDPPFGIRFTGKNTNYNRKSTNVVGGYVEWPLSEYEKNIARLLEVIDRNLKPEGQALIFSGWNNSHLIHQQILRFEKLTLRGKFYWIYNFAPVCRRKPAHNVYEIYWITKGAKWTFHKRCSTHHCLEGEPNLASLHFKRDYKVNMPKYPTRLPFDLLKCLLEHFSNRNDLVFDPLCGSGMVGVAASMLERNFVMGDLNENGRVVFKHLLEFYLKDSPKRKHFEH
ncbi:MAG: hypothetical protein KatS3mg099_339 [Candidatus Parcubacteria bacterium]|nr:MAG: hypothetical protein KatS3mg099_339 [Candidatus Parcubacteria bacterium]